MTIVLIRPRFIGAVASAMWLVFMTFSSHAQELRVHVSEDSVTVGQRFYLSIAAEHDFTADPAFPEASDSLMFGDLEVLRLHDRNSFALEDMRIDSIVYEVTTFALDTATVSPIPIRFTAGEDTFSVRTPVTRIPILSLVPPEAREVRDLAPLVEFPRSIWAYIAGGALLLLLAALLAFYLWKRRGRDEVQVAPPRAPSDPPHIEAMKRLQAIEDVDLHRREAVQPFYTEVSDIVRHYLARRLHVNAKEMTTRELIRDLGKHDILQADTRDELQIVLSLADYVKFADAEPAPEEGRGALSSVRTLVRAIEDALRPAEPTPEDSELAHEEGRID